MWPGAKHAEGLLSHSLSPHLLPQSDYGNRHIKCNCGKCCEEIALGATRLGSRQGVEVGWVVWVMEGLSECVTFMLRNN